MPKHHSNIGTNTTRIAGCWTKLTQSLWMLVSALRSLWERKQYTHDIEMWNSELKHEYKIVDKCHQQFHNVPQKLWFMPYKDHFKIHAKLKKRADRACCIFQEMCCSGLRDNWDQVSTACFEIDQVSTACFEILKCLPWIFARGGGMARFGLPWMENDCFVNIEHAVQEIWLWYG